MNASGYHRGPLRDVMDGLTKTVYTFSISLAALFFGRYLGTHMKVFVPHPPRWAQTLLSTFSVLLYAAAFPLYFRLSPSFRHQATSAILFAVPGALTRYAVSTKFNLPSRIPWGTFGINTAGTALLGVFHVLQRLDISPNACSTLQGLSDGYCGCLTTISTFAVEITVLTGNRKWLYPFGSWLVAQLLLLVIIGPALLSGIKERSMCDFAQ